MNENKPYVVLTSKTPNILEGFLIDLQSFTSTLTKLDEFSPSSHSQDLFQNIQKNLYLNLNLYNITSWCITTKYYTAELNILAAFVSPVEPLQSHDPVKLLDSGTSVATPIYPQIQNPTTKVSENLDKNSLLNSNICKNSDTKSSINSSEIKIEGWMYIICDGIEGEIENVKSLEDKWSHVGLKCIIETKKPSDFKFQNLAHIQDWSFDNFIEIIYLENVTIPQFHLPSQNSLEINSSKNEISPQQKGVSKLNLPKQHINFSHLEKAKEKLLNKDHNCTNTYETQLLDPIHNPNNPIHNSIKSSTVKNQEVTRPSSKSEYKLPRGTLLGEPTEGLNRIVEILECHMWPGMKRIPYYNKKSSTSPILSVDNLENVKTFSLSKSPKDSQGFHQNISSNQNLDNSECTNLHFSSFDQFVKKSHSSQTNSHMFAKDTNKPDNDSKFTSDPYQINLFEVDTNRSTEKQNSEKIKDFTTQPQLKERQTEDSKAGNTGKKEKTSTGSSNKKLDPSWNFDEMDQLMSLLRQVRENSKNLSTSERRKAAEKAATLLLPLVDDD